MCECVCDSDCGECERVRDEQNEFEELFSSVGFTLRGIL